MVVKIKNFILFFLMASAILAGCSNHAAQNETDSNKKIIAATFYPIYDLTKSIATDAQVFSVVPAGAEPHDYQPTPNDIIKLGESSAFVTIGLEFEEFEERLVLGTGGKITVITASEGINLLDANIDDSKEEEHEEGEKIHSNKEEHNEEDEHDHLGKDPHVWLSPNNMIIMAKNINEGLKEVYPQSAKLYDENANKLIEDLKKLDEDFRKELPLCKKKHVLVSHRAFAYLANDYGFEQIAISGLEPETEPSPREIARLGEEAREHGIKYIFYEELVDPRVANTIAREIRAKTLELNPIEGTKNPSENYISLMRKNLANLKLALECE
jgi:zinc transport system substrate-binding protein